MFVDSHCHLNFHELADNLDEVLANMRSNGVSEALCVSVNLENFPQILALAEQYPHIYASVGVHPDNETETEPTLDKLLELVRHPKVIAIGETGLDYFRLKGDLEWQRERFRIHIRAAIASGKPLIIHTREAAQDTLRIMAEEGADRVGGVMHCFTESLDVALAAIEMNFYISFSGIVTFKNATAIKEVASQIPIERMLIETDAPYLAPVPYRGKLNQPAYVKYVAEQIAALRAVPLEQVASATTANFHRLFKTAA
ncbi:MAG: YchF/TatD family DNA exonuclease [Gammaproteobacteria bacterium]|nr:YchF/TatD family DNA exonuclease [Gammaproteobacteria bacterium]